MLLNATNAAYVTESLRVTLLERNSNYSYRVMLLEALQRAIMGLTDGKQFNRTITAKVEKELAITGEVRYDQKFSHIELSVCTNGITEEIRLPNDRYIVKDALLSQVNSLLTLRHERLKSIGEQIAKADAMLDSVKRVSAAYGEMVAGLSEFKDQFPELDCSLKMDKGAKDQNGDYIFLNNHFK